MHIYSGFEDHAVQVVCAGISWHLSVELIGI